MSYPDETDMSIFYSPREPKTRFTVVVRATAIPDESTTEVCVFICIYRFVSSNSLPGLSKLFSPCRGLSEHRRQDYNTSQYEFYPAIQEHKNQDKRLMKDKMRRGRNLRTSVRFATIALANSLVDSSSIMTLLFSYAGSHSLVLRENIKCSCF